MFKTIKKEWNELKNNQSHLEYVPENSFDPEYNFKELLKLSQRTSSRFKLSGNHNKFKIQTDSNNIFLGISICIILVFPSLLLLQNLDNIICWIIEFVTLLSIFFFFKFYATTNDIEIDSTKKNITIKSNNLIGKFIIPPVTIPFNDFIELTNKPKSISGLGLPSHHFNIFISYNDKTIPLIELPNGPFYIVNPNVFMICLTRLIKNQN
ncbi:MAG: hypothetical protein R2852_07425 [Bacteroidia bacterium]